MNHSDGSLTEDARLDQHTFSLIQFGRVEGAIFAFLLGVFLVMGGIVGAEALAAGVLVALAAAGMMVWELVSPQRATLTLTEGGLSAYGMFDRVPIRRTRTVPLAGTAVSVERGPEILGRQSWRLTLSHPDGDVRLRGLIGTEAELARVEAVLSAAAERAAARQGAGAAEVPAPLRQRLERDPG